jgi:uncharacterized protein YggT (Ycf19 family)
MAETSEEHRNPETTINNAETDQTVMADKDIAAIEEARAKSTRKITQFVDYVYWIVMALIAVRFTFKLIGANAENALVQFLYNASDPFINIFKGIVPDITTSGSSVIEISALIALLIIWLLYHAILKLIIVLRTK